MAMMKIVSPSDPRIPLGVAHYYRNAQAYEDQKNPGNPLPDFFCKAARQAIRPTETVFDMGCGAGLAGEMLVKAGHRGLRIANDVSLDMIAHSLAKGYYSEAYHCNAIRAVEELKLVGGIDWAVALSMSGYLDSEDLKELLYRLYETCRRGVIMSFEALTPEQITASMVPVYPHTYDEVVATLPKGWKVETMAGVRGIAVLLCLSRKT